MKYSILVSAIIAIVAILAIPIPFSLATGVLGAIVFVCSMLILEFCC